MKYYNEGWVGWVALSVVKCVTECSPLESCCSCCLLAFSTALPGMLSKTSGLMNLSQDELANNMDLVQINGQVHT